VVAVGIGLDGTKHPLGLVEGSTQNAALVTDLLVGLRERGLEETRQVVCVLDMPRRDAAQPPPDPSATIHHATRGGVLPEM
jgi:hypothetical protein